MPANIAGLGVIYNKLASQNQQLFQLLAVPGDLSLVYVNGVVQSPGSYTIDRNVLSFNFPLMGGEWVYVLSGRGGTFVPQSYIDDVMSTKADSLAVINLLKGKADVTGVNFTGIVRVQEPTDPMSPVTKQMFDSLPPIATPNQLISGLNLKADKTTLDTIIANMLIVDHKGASNGIAELNAQGDIKENQYSDFVLLKEKSFYFSGALTIGVKPQVWWPRQSSILKGILAYVNTAPLDQSIIIDVRKNGISIFPTPANRLIIPAGQNKVEINLEPTPSMVRGDKIDFNVEQIGISSTGSDLNIQLEYVSSI